MLSMIAMIVLKHVNTATVFIREKAKSVAGMVSRYKLSSNSATGTYSFNRNLTLNRAMNVCTTERFFDQTVLPNCTGFLVAPDVLVTAGHCVTSMSACRDNVWVFDYTDTTTNIKSQDVYSCSEVIGHKLTLGLLAIKDYAVIKLDRPVRGRKPLEFRKRGRVKKGSDVLVIGHPSGLPLKIADNAEVMDTTWNTFRTNLDAFGGNSGSPVFNTRTGLVEGILIQGAQDYQPSMWGCNVSAQRRSTEKQSVERVFKITKVKEL